MDQQLIEGGNHFKYFGHFNTMTNWPLKFTNGNLVNDKEELFCKVLRFENTCFYIQKKGFGIFQIFYSECRPL